MSGPPPFPSYPGGPRPPMPMGMPPPMGMGPPPMGMMPFGPPMPGMGMPPGMMPGMPMPRGPFAPMPLPNRQPVRPAGGRAGIIIPASIAEKSTTVYVGKIAPTVLDDVIKTLLESCGTVRSWKRQEDPETKQPKGFGFCEFEDAEGVLRAMRLLNGVALDGQELLLKCNTATQKYIDSYEAQKNAEKAARLAKANSDTAKRAEDGELVDSAEAKPAEDADQAADNRVLEVIMSVVSEREEKAAAAGGGTKKSSKGSNGLPPPPDQPPVTSAGEFLNMIGAQPATTDSKAEREREREEYEARQREREWEREAEAERRRDEEKRREAEARYDSKLREWERLERERAKERDRERDRLSSAELERRRAMRADLENPDSDEERAPWERRGLRGSRRAAERRKRRQAEEAEDDLDRQREAREVEVAARRAAEAAAAAAAVAGTLQPEGTPGPAGSSVAGGIKAEPDVDPNDPIYQAMLAAARAPAAAAPLPQPHHRAIASHAAVKQEIKQERGGESPLHPAAAAAAASSGQRAAAPGGAGGKRTNVMAMFADEEEEGTQKRKLKPIQYSEEEMRAVQDGYDPQQQDQQQGLQASTSLPPPPKQPHLQQPMQAVLAPAVSRDPKAALKAMMDSIPTSKDQVFQYSIKWDYYDPTAVGDKVKNWVGIKVKELLGVPEPTLVDYVVKLLSQRCTPENLFAELNPVLDNDTETFIINLYRMIIFETEKAAMKH